MSRLVCALPVRHWRVVLALTSLVIFALAGSADDPMPM
jgi:hypothetical protein